MKTKLTKRIIPCLDVKEGKVVKGIRFRDHKIVGEILELVEFYSNAGADELVFYDISASGDQRSVDRTWIDQIAKRINIPFCVAGGIRTLSDAEKILNAGADKISINSPALESPQLINRMVDVFGQQCVVIGVDSFEENGQYYVYQYTGDETKTRKTNHLTKAWIKEVEERGAGEIVLNCMNQDGVRQGYDIVQLQKMGSLVTIPLIASGGAGKLRDFYDVFSQSEVSGALAASVFHQSEIDIHSLKQYLHENEIGVRL